MTGDIAKKTDTGGLFEVEDADRERPRFEAREITYTGPIFGTKMRRAMQDAGDLENLILEQNEVSGEMLRRSRLDGTRRTARLLPGPPGYTSPPLGPDLRV